MMHKKYQEEITREEYYLLQKRLCIHNSSHVGLELATEIIFNTNESQHLRQDLYQQYLIVAQKAKEDMIELYLSSAKAQMERYHKQFYTKLKQFWLAQQSVPSNNRMTKLVIDLIEQRLENISESVKCTYKYKFDLLHMNSAN